MVHFLIESFPQIYPWVWVVGVSCLLANPTWRSILFTLVFFGVLFVSNPPPDESNLWILWGNFAIELVAIGVGAWSFTKFPYYFSDTTKYRVAMVAAIIGYSSFSGAFYIGYQKAMQEQPIYYEEPRQDPQRPSEGRV